MKKCVVNKGQHVLGPTHDRRVFEEGEEIEIDDQQADNLIAAGVVSLKAYRQVVESKPEAKPVANVKVNPEVKK